jgi:small subunit ribosomal protein S17
VNTKTVEVSDSAARKTGIVEGDKRDKTRQVVINFLAKHSKYGKYVRRRTVLQVHDEENTSRVGDQVEIAECRPLSKTKSWTITKVVQRAVDSDEETGA